MDFVSHLGWTFLLSQARKDWRKQWKEFLLFGVLPDLAFAIPMLVLLAPQALAVIAAGFEVPSFQSFSGTYYWTHGFPSAFFAFVVAYVVLRRIYWPLLGWLLHVSLDVFTHKGSVALQMPFYPLQFSVEGFVHWSNLSFMLANWLAIAIVFALYYMRVAGAQPRSNAVGKIKKGEGVNYF